MSKYASIRRRTNALPIVIGAVVVLSMFPVSWLRWTSDLADLVRIPVMPISHVGMLLTNWVRPGIELSDLPSDENVRNELVITERDQFRQLYHAQLLRATELADQLRALQSLPESALLNAQPPLILPLDLTGINPGDVASIVELKLVRGASDRIREGDIAIVGTDIVGRIVRVGRTRIELKPITHKEIGLIRAAVVLAHPSQEDEHQLRSEILLQSQGDGFLYAQVPTASRVQIGDLVVLDDSSWPPSGRGLILGTVVEVLQLDEAPLRQSLTIAPRRMVRDVSQVVVLGSVGTQVP